MSSSQTPTQQLALQAAQWLFENQKNQGGSSTLAEKDPSRPRARPLSTRSAAEKFGVSKTSVARQFQALKNGKPNASTGTRAGRPNRLTDVEEQMLSFHTFMLRREMRPVNMKVIREAANALLSRRKSPAAPVSSSWVRRWLRADRAHFQEELLSKGTSTLPEHASKESQGVETDSGDENADHCEDALSEVEIPHPNPILTVLGNSALGTGSGAIIEKQKLASGATEVLTNIKSA